MNIVYKETIELHTVSHSQNQDRYARRTQTHPNVTVHHQANSQQPVQHRVRRSADDEGSSGQGHESRAKQTFESPVVRAVAPIRWRECGGVVDCPPVDGWCGKEKDVSE